MALTLIATGNLVTLAPFTADSAASGRAFKVGVRYPDSFDRGILDIYAYGVLYGDRFDSLAEFWQVQVFEFRSPFSLWEGVVSGGAWRIDILPNLEFGAPCPEEVRIYKDV